MCRTVRLCERQQQLPSRAPAAAHPECGLEARNGRLRYRARHRSAQTGCYSALAEAEQPANFGGEAVSNQEQCDSVDLKLPPSSPRSSAAVEVDQALAEIPDRGGLQTAANIADKTDRAGA